MQDVEIILNPNIFKKHNQYFSHMIIKWSHIRQILQPIKSDIFRNSWLTIQFQ
jgi:hypothetical protein